MPGGHWQQIPKTLLVICGAQSQAPLCGRGSLRVPEFELMVALLLSMVCQVCLLSGRELMIRMNCGRTTTTTTKKKRRVEITFKLPAHTICIHRFIHLKFNPTNPSLLDVPDCPGI